MQKSASPVARDIVLLGGGHSHVQVLKRFGMQPQPGVRLTLISEDRVSPYSGMLPGALAGIYSADDIHINLDALCQFAGARFICAQATGLDLAQQQLQLQNRPGLRYDLLSINTGALPSRPHDAAITVKPISRFLPKWQELLATLGDSERVLIVGGGAGGVEVALAARAAMPAGTHITLAGHDLMAGHHVRMQRTVAKRLQQAGVAWVQGDVRCASDGAVSLAGHDYPVSRVLWVTGVQAPAWYADCGLATDEGGFVTVNEFLQSVSDERVFAAGDIADLSTQPRPKSGVFAVRAGPVLAHNLRRAVLQQPLRAYRAQARHLALLGCGDHTALASRNRLVLGGGFTGRMLWWLKDVIDQRFLNKFNKLPEMSNPESDLPEVFRDALPETDMRCGGCGAKLAADPLRQVLARLPAQRAEHVVLGMGDDAAEILNSGQTSLLSVDGFRAMISDSYLFGRIVAHHSLNDLFAMGAKPTAALAFATVPLMAEALMADELFQVLHGVADVLNESGAMLVGGHSAEGAELSIGLTVMGTSATASLTKAGCEAGDVLLLTKPLGTGTLLAAAMRGQASADSIAAVSTGMDTSNAALGEVFATRAHALTDVTGFGLLGHLGEMLRASSVGVHLYIDQVPVYPGALETISAAPSSLQLANELALRDYVLRDGLLPDMPRVRLLMDPQTSGGMLAAVPPGALNECLDAVREAGHEAAIIGHIAATDDVQIFAASPQEQVR